MSSPTVNVIKMPLGYFRVDPLPSEEELAAFYNGKYYGSVKPAMYRTDSPEEMRWVARMSRLAADILLRLRPERHGAGFLDVGCGPGYLLAEMHRRALPVAGIDPDPGAAAHYNPDVASTVIQGLWQTIKDAPSPGYDWINLSHVLEHVREPEQALRRLAGLLAPGGIVRLSVPNDFSLFQTSAERAKLARPQFWVCPPDHLNYFDFASCARLLEAMGFEVLLRQSDFPIDLFLLMGRDYTRDADVGRTCHFERMLFEEALDDASLQRLYEGFAGLGIGRSAILHARRP